MSERLKPCPWCGEEHICLFEVQDEDGSAFAVGCVSEDCPGHVAASWRYITREKAIEAWNTRAELTFPDEVQEAQHHLCELERMTGEAWKPERTCKLVKSFEEPGFMESVMEYECSECGGLTNAQIFHESDEPRYCMMCGARLAKEEI